MSSSSVMFPNESGSNSPADDAEVNQQIDMTAEVSVENPEADSSANVPPPAGDKVYPIRYSLDEEREGGAVIPSLTKRGAPFLNVFLKGNIIAEGVDDNFPIRRYMNTIQNRTGNSDVHYFLYCAGEPVANKMSLEDLKNKIEEVLASNPTVLGLCDWRAQYPDGTKNAKGKDNYKTLREGMKNFPKGKDENGKTVYNHILENPRDGSKVSARLEVFRDLTQAEASKLK